MTGCRKAGDAQAGRYRRGGSGPARAVWSAASVCRYRRCRLPGRGDPPHWQSAKSAPDRIFLMTMQMFWRRRWRNPCCFHQAVHISQPMGFYVRRCLAETAVGRYKAHRTEAARPPLACPAGRSRHGRRGAQPHDPGCEAGFHSRRLTSRTGWGQYGLLTRIRAPTPRSS